MDEKGHGTVIFAQFHSDISDVFGEAVLVDPDIRYSHGLHPDQIVERNYAITSSLGRPSRFLDSHHHHVLSHDCPSRWLVVG